MLPKPGSNEWEDMVDFMRKDLESGMSYSKIIEHGRKIVDNGMRCRRCGNIWQRDKNSTGYCEDCGSADVIKRVFEDEFKRFQEGKSKR